MRQSLPWISIAAALSCGASCVMEPEESGDRPRLKTTRSAVRSIGAGIIPHQHPELWPYHVSSSRIVVHYQTPDVQDMAEEVLGHVEHAWQVQIDQGGALPPLDDGGAAGPDGRFDVYLQADIVEPYVVGVAPDETTWYDDTSTAMVVDPWGEYGGDELEANIFHELRHASQGANDWWEHPHAFEAEATMWEIAEYGFERVPVVWEDYQGRPEWTLFRDDRYQTWYMYGGALFLLYLRDHAFGGKLGFSNQLWLGARNAPGAQQHPHLNEPDFVDVLSTLLAAKGKTLFGEVLGFARARWRTGARDDGSLPGGAVLPDVAHRTHTRKKGAIQTSFSVSPQLLGTSYTVVERATTDPQTLRASLSTSAAGVRFAVQVLGGPAGDVTLDLSNGSVPVSFGSSRKLTFVVTALPASGPFDPDEVSSTARKATLKLTRLP